MPVHHQQGKEKRISVPVPPPFLKRPCDGAKKRPVPMNLPFFAVEAYVPGEVQDQAEKKIQKMPSGRSRHQNSTFPDQAANGKRASPNAIATLVPHPSQTCLCVVDWETLLSVLESNSSPFVP